jgi:LmbE family N-acetylglucosaminyl deacetylase
MKPIQRVCLSAHLDDVEYSIGGVVAKWAREGEAPVVVTVFAGSSPRPLTKLGLMTNTEAGIPSEIDMPRLRRAETAAAMDRLGVTQHVELPLLDAIYRRKDDGHDLCDTWEAPFQLPLEVEGRTLRAVVTGLSETLRDLEPAERYELYLPLTFGNHIDHRIVRRAGELLAEGSPRKEVIHVLYFEDQPYAMDPNRAAGHRRAYVTRESRGNYPVPLLPEDVDAWIDAIECHESQEEDLFGELPDWRIRLRESLRDENAYSCGFWTPDVVLPLPIAEARLAHLASAKSLSN